MQNIPDWHQVVRRYYETKNVQLFLTGSSVKLLSKEIVTSLRGRSLLLKIKDAYGKPLKNQVYLDLRRQGKDIYFYNTSDAYEIDFVTIDKQGFREIIQVVWDMSDPKTHDRERRALQQAEKELGFSGRIISVKDYLREQTQSTGSLPIDILTFSRWHRS